MALGGYKFVGYHYTVPSGYDSSDQEQVRAQCLRMFKCRLKAFIDSCSASGAEWEFSFTDGQNAFGDYGNVVYTLDSDGYNFGCFFKYKDREQYYCLASFQKLNSSFASEYYRYYSSDVVFVDNYFPMSSIGKSPITPTNWSSFKTGNLMFRSAINTNTKWSATTPNITNYHFGFATKDCDVVEFVSPANSQYPYFHASSANGFTTLCSPSDSCPAVDIVDFGNLVAGNAATPIRKYVGVTRGDGSPFIGPNGRTSDGIMCIFQNTATTFQNPNDAIPYASALVTADFINKDYTSGYYTGIVNNDGIRSKGFTKVEFIATNTPFYPNTLNIYKPYNNGTLFCFAKMQPNSDGYLGSRCALYCGWDPSNPDITQSSAWTEYTEE